MIESKEVIVPTPDDALAFALREVEHYNEVERAINHLPPEVSYAQAVALVKVVALVKAAAWSPPDQAADALAVALREVEHYNEVEYAIRLVAA